MCALAYFLLITSVIQCLQEISYKCALQIIFLFNYAHVSLQETVTVCLAGLRESGRVLTQTQATITHMSSSFPGMILSHSGSPSSTMTEINLVLLERNTSTTLETTDRKE